MRRWRPVWLRVVADAAMAVLALPVAFWFRFQVMHTFVPVPEQPDVPRYALAAPIAGLCVVTVFALMGVYRNRRGVQFIDELFSVVGAMAVTFFVVFALIGLYRLDKPGGSVTYSRVTFVLWVGATTILVSISRYVLRRWEASRRARGIGAERTVIIGDGAAADLLIQRIRMFPDYGYRLEGVIANGGHSCEEFSGVPVLGTLQEVRRVVAERRAEVVFVALPEEAHGRVLEVVETCRDLDADVRIVPGTLEIMTTQVTADQLEGIPLLQLRRGLDLDGPKAALKRAFDVLVGTVGVTLSAPLMGLVALLIRVTSSGQVMIHQERVGIDGRTFAMHKFRTMRADAEADSGPVWAVPDDPRVTSIGRILRRTSLDELPQFWNILVGEMSLVGPRPERPMFVDEFSSQIRRYSDRHRVRPGLTGWAQVNDLRGQTPVEERLIYDLYYIENWSLAFDLKIALIQLFRIFSHKNAY